MMQRLFLLNGANTAPVEMPNKFGLAVDDSIGVCAIVMPWKFSPAIVAGNTVVFKPSPETPALAAAFVKVMEDARLPAGAD